MPLLWRRAHPVLAAVGVLGAIALQSAVVDLDAFPLGDMLAMVAASYAIGAHSARRGGIVVLGAGAAAHAALVYPNGVVAALLGGVALPWAVGRVVRSNRALTRAGRRRNAEIEDSRRREALAAVTRERVRVARELHDAVAHNVSVIAIQAGGAEGLVDRDPGRTADVVALIATVAEEALAELGRLTGTASATRAEPEPRRRPRGTRESGRAGGHARGRRPSIRAARGHRPRRVPDRPGGAGELRQARSGRPRVGDGPLRAARDRARDRRRRPRPRRRHARPAATA